MRTFGRLFASSMGTFSEASSLRCRINDGRLSSSKTRSSSSSKPVRLCGSVPFEACSARSRQSFMRIPSQIATQLIVDSPTRLGNNAHLLRKCRNLLLAVATRGMNCSRARFCKIGFTSLLTGVPHECLLLFARKKSEKPQDRLQHHF